MEIADRFRDFFGNAEAVFFDMDGTLIDSLFMWAQIDDAYLGSFGVTPPAGLQKEINGRSIKETADYFKETFPEVTDSPEEMMKTWNRMAFEWYSTKSELKPGAFELLNCLKTMGIPLGIATSNSAVLLKAALKHLNILELFDTLRTGDMHLPGKPAPDLYLAAAKDLKVSPGSCIVFEDIDLGLLAGRNAGMRTVAVYDNENEAEQDRKKALSDLFIYSFEELLEKRD